MNMKQWEKAFWEGVGRGIAFWVVGIGGLIIAKLLYG